MLDDKTSEHNEVMVNLYKLCLIEDKLIWKYPVLGAYVPLTAAMGAEELTTKIHSLTGLARK